MDKGIRNLVNHKFAELLPQRAELGNTKFRKTIMAFAMDECSITLASASTHYNHAFKECKKSNPELVLGLGRADDKKGGRKPKAAVTCVMADPYFFPTEAAVEATAPAAVEEVAVVEEAAPRYAVKRVKDGVYVGTDMEKAAADELVAKAVKGKKAKLEAVEMSATSEVAN